MFNFFNQTTDAEYAETIEIDASGLSPSIACPHTVDNVRTIEDVAGQKIDARLAATGGWGNPRWCSLGTVEVDKAGVYHVRLGSANPSTWKAVNVWGLRLLPTR